jgi:hypothetical protein
MKTRSGRKGEAPPKELLHKLIAYQISEDVASVPVGMAHQDQRACTSKTCREMALCIATLTSAKER